jgi:hypothetical protein
MLYHLVITIVLLGLLLAAWVGFQAWVRRLTPGMSEDADVLRGRFGSCGVCLGFEACKIPGLVADSDVLEVDSVDEVAL